MVVITITTLTTLMIKVITIVTTIRVIMIKLNVKSNNIVIQKHCISNENDTNDNDSQNIIITISRP